MDWNRTSVCACLALLLIGSADCRGDRTTAPGGMFTGTWSGAIEDSVVGAGTLSLKTVQEGIGVSGTWSATFLNGTARAGTAGGTISGLRASLFLTPSVTILCASGQTIPGGMAVTASLSGTRLTGTYVVLDCTSATSGTINLEREP